jgi:hypothetical protein
MTLAPEYRRCALYVVVAAGALPVVAWLARHLVPQRTSANWVGLLVMNVLIAVAGLAVLGWRLRLDATGIARRRLLTWDLWPWGAFRDGRIKEDVQWATFHWPGHGWWRDRLTLQLLREEDRETALRTIDKFWVRQEPPGLPKELLIRYAFQRQAEFSARGIVLTHRGVVRRFHWDDVHSVRIDRLERARNDFRELELVLPGEILRFQAHRANGQTSHTWSGGRDQERPESAVVAGLILRYAPPGRVLVYSLTEPPASPHEWARARERLERREKDMRQVTTMFRIGMVAASVTCLFMGEAWKCAVMLTMIWIMFFGPCWLILHDQSQGLQRAREELESHRPPE